ncbi:hypothetical protein M514_04556 [Trichuris suis]|uniref:Uncharacterized protein n=1 Tax=Trichuris suis TaxID=68888 RepID=A0A085NIE4_9BILA|nr:hypothetical protein M513_04556 [Trichuris suis]KFD69240.1 hypothetical protein M514_04556 [Trichuris suis]
MHAERLKLHKSIESSLAKPSITLRQWFYKLTVLSVCDYLSRTHCGVVAANKMYRKDHALMQTHILRHSDDVKTGQQRKWDEESRHRLQAAQQDVALARRDIATFKAKDQKEIVACTPIHT